MAPSRLTIDKKQFKRLKHEIIERMVAVDNFIDHAAQLDLITTQEEEDIKSYKKVSDQVRKILRIIKKKLAENSCHFLKSLMETGNEILALKLSPQNMKNSELRKALEMNPDYFEDFDSRYLIEPGIFKQFRVSFIQDLDVKEFMDDAYPMKILTRYDYVGIRSITDPHEQARKLYEIILKKLPEISDRLLYCLKYSGNDHLMEDFLEKLNYGRIIDFSHFHVRDGSVLELKGKIPFEEPKLLSIVDIDPWDIWREFDRNNKGLTISDIGLALFLNQIHIRNRMIKEIRNNKSFSPEMFLSKTMYERFSGGEWIPTESSFYEDVLSGGRDLLSPERLSELESLISSVRERIPSSFVLNDLKMDPEPKENVICLGCPATRLFKASVRVNNEKFIHVWFHKIKEKKKRNKDEEAKFLYCLTFMLCTDDSIDYVGTYWF